MADLRRIKLLHGLESTRTTITPQEGEPIATTDELKLYIGDGSKTGGYIINADNTIGICLDQAIASVKHSLAWWINYFNGNPATIRIPRGTHDILTNLTVPSNICLKFDNGAYFNVASGVILTVNGDIDAGLWEVYTGSGTVNGTAYHPTRPESSTPVYTDDSDRIATTAFVKDVLENSPALNGTPTAPTAVLGTNNTQIANTSYVKTEINAVLAASDVLIFKGTLGTGGIITELPTSDYKIGWSYKIITAGTYANIVCEIGDMIVCVSDFDTTFKNSDWTIIQSNLDGAVIGPVSSISNNIALFDGITGKLIKDSSKSLSDLATSTHIHGNITNDGKIGSTASLPIITTTSGVLTTGSFGTTSGTFCQGNDSRLSDARTPISHVHGNITNDGKIGIVSGLMIKTSTNGELIALAAGTSGQYLQYDGTWSTPPDTDTVYTHPTSGVSVGTYTSVTVDTNGHVTTGTNPTAVDKHFTATEAQTVFDISDIYPSSYKAIFVYVNGLFKINTVDYTIDTTEGSEALTLNTASLLNDVVYIMFL